INGKVCAGDDRDVLSAYAKNFRQHTDEIAAVLRGRGHEDMIFEKTQKLGSERPTLGDLLLKTRFVCLRLLRIEQPYSFARISMNHLLDFSRRYRTSILEQSMQDKLLAILARCLPFEVDYDRTLS